MALLVKIGNKKDEKFVAELLSKLGYTSTAVDFDELEDMAFSSIMKRNSKKDVLSVSEAKAVYKRLPRKK